MLEQVSAQWEQPCLSSLNLENCCLRSHYTAYWLHSCFLGLIKTLLWLIYCAVLHHMLVIQLISRPFLFFYNQFILTLSQHHCQTNLLNNDTIRIFYIPSFYTSVWGKRQGPVHLYNLDILTVTSNLGALAGWLRTLEVVSWWQWVGAGCTVWWCICMKYYPGTWGGGGGGGGGREGGTEEAAQS